MGRCLHGIKSNCDRNLGHASLGVSAFGVKVVTVVTEAVSTNALSRGVNFELPANSIYMSIEEEIAARARGEDGTRCMEPSVYAEQVVADSPRGANGQIGRGSYASIVRFKSYLFEPSILVSLPPTIRSRRHWPNLRSGLNVDSRNWIGRH